MSFGDCTETFKKVVPDATDNELLDIFEALESHKRYLMSTDSALTDIEARLQASKNIAEDLELAAMIEKRNAAINYKKRVELVGFVANTFGFNPSEGVEAMLMGVNRAKTGARAGAAQRIATTQHQYLSAFNRDLEKTGAMDVFASGVMDREIANVLLKMSKGDDIAGHSKEAVSLAGVIRKYQDALRVDANKHGAFIKQRSDYIFQQTHDTERIMRAGRDEWLTMARDKFDLPAMMNQSGALDVEAMLDATYKNLASGNHEKAQAEITGFKGSANVAKKMSQSRSIIFKDADSAMDYNERFGRGNLRELVGNHINSASRNIALLKSLGTNPRAMVDAVVSDVVSQLKRAGDVEKANALDGDKNKFSDYVDLLDGTADIPGNVTGAKISANIRSFNILTSLGGMVLSQFSDIPTYAAGARYQGRGFLSGMHEAVSGLGRSLSGDDVKDVSSALNVMLEDITGDIGRIGGMQDPGMMNKLVRGFMKMNLSDWWQKRMRTSAAFGMSHYLALQAGKSFDAINADMQRVLGTYGIGSAEWDIIRQASQMQANEKPYITADGISSLPDSVMAGYIGEASSPRAMQRAREDIAEKLRMFFVDQGSFMALDPDLKTKSYLLQNTRPGTIMGEIARFAMQFKSFTGAYMQKVIGRELYGRGFEGNGVLGALRHGNGEFSGLMSLVVTMTLAGYASMALKDLMKGKTPRDPTESPEMGAKIIAASLVQGGGMGIMGDLLFGESNRFGGGFLPTLAGPTLSKGASVVDLFHRSVRGETTAAEAFNTGLSFTPYSNLFYVRPVLNYGLIYSIQDSLSPGYLRRMERRAEEENAQSFFVRPSEVAR